jgi:release factor glutamine methyltransferase
VGDVAALRDDAIARLRAAGCVYPEGEWDELARAAGAGADLPEMLARRCTGEPLEHVVGSACFGGVRLALGPGSFVPRERTLLLARRAAAELRPGDVLLDLACGAGTIGAWCAAHVAGLTIRAVDVDERAAAWARVNLPEGARVTCGDATEYLAGTSERFTVIAANLPYVPTAAVTFLPRDLREHEPLSALDGGGDGLDPLRRVARLVPLRLTPGGLFLVEVAASQVEAAARLLTDAGFDSVRGLTDPGGDATIVEGRASRR